ncbi:MAG: tRNA (adenosine(37)-N6)-threonylcarbamoyltransferase complex transferase subunit TsaD [Pseudomonadota bacterium]
MTASARDVLILGLETSCDETAAAVVQRTTTGEGRILSNVIRSQWAAHAPFGGVVPEIAARAHCEVLDVLVAQALNDAGIGLSDVDAIAATAGPGLIGGLIVGLVSAKALAFASGKPMIGVNHLEAHALTVGLSDGLQPPYLLLLVSGGHSQILLVRGIGDYVRLGTTIDDALGEAFDKTAKLLGLAQPGGPAVESAAQAGDTKRFDLPRPLIGRPEPNFSFAGLKTAIRQQARALEPLSDQDVADLCASFQAAVRDTIVDRMQRAIDITIRTHNIPKPPLVIAGGVAANAFLREGLSNLAAKRDLPVCLPPLSLCGDNAAMIAWVGAERLAAGLIDENATTARPRWPLDEQATPLIGHGRKGAKA